MYDVFGISSLKFNEVRYFSITQCGFIFLGRYRGLYHSHSMLWLTPNRLRTTWKCTFCLRSWVACLWKTTSFNACRKSFLANVHRTGFNSWGIKPTKISRRSSKTGKGDNGDVSMCSSSTIKKNGNQQPAKITIVISKTLRPRHSWIIDRWGCWRVLFNWRSRVLRLNEM